MITKNQKLTGRERRMQHFKQMQRGPGMNLVSLMDIFTILVFFLLVNSSAQQLPSSKDVKLPLTVATTVPDENLVLTVTKESILVQGKEVARVQDVLATAETVIPALSQELKGWAAQRTLAVAGESLPRSVMILGDESIPYALLRKILSTCQDARYSEILFAAHHVGKSKGAQ